MLDILEDFMVKKRYTYFRLDGSLNIADRRDMVNEFQKNDKIFAFLLSTRAGGLGITLTAANTVIFYDNDWNPTMDAQATDRAHRIGQSRDVYVYRMVTKGTIEERIVKRAQQKQTVQSTVYDGANNMKAGVFKPQDVREGLCRLLSGSWRITRGRRRRSWLCRRSRCRRRSAGLVKARRKGNKPWKSRSERPSCDPIV